MYSGKTVVNNLSLVHGQVSFLSLLSFLILSNTFLQFISMRSSQAEQILAPPSSNHRESQTDFFHTYGEIQYV